MVVIVDLGQKVLSVDDRSSGFSALRSGSNPVVFVSAPDHGALYGLRVGVILACVLIGMSR